MIHDKEIAALREHFARRGLDIAGGSEIALLWLALNLGLAAGDESDLQRRVDQAASYLRQEAAKIMRTLQGTSAKRVQ